MASVRRPDRRLAAGGAARKRDDRPALEIGDGDFGVAPCRLKAALRPSGETIGLAMSSGGRFDLSVAAHPDEPGVQAMLVARKVDKSALVRDGATRTLLPDPDCLARPDRCARCPQSFNVERHGHQRVEPAEQHVSRAHIAAGVPAVGDRLTRPGIELEDLDGLVIARGPVQTVSRIALPPGSTWGQRWLISPFDRSSVVTADGVPPPLGTFMIRCC